MDDKRYQEILSLRASGRVVRWHTVPTLGTPQDVANHSAQALSLLFLLHPGDPPMTLVKGLLWHDSSERYCGDVPSPVRRANPVLADAYLAAERAFAESAHPSICFTLSEYDHRWLRSIDVLELFLHCEDQKMLGNAHFDVISDRARSWLLDSGNDSPPEVIRFVRWFCDGGGPRNFA